MNNIINVLNENNELEEVEVIDFFQLDEYDHEYVLYTKNEEDGEDTVTYISILNEVGDDKFQFEEITDQEELKKVEEKIEQELDLLASE